eukprot:gene8163-9594_t
MPGLCMASEVFVVPTKKLSTKVAKLRAENVAYIRIEDIMVFSIHNIVEEIGSDKEALIFTNVIGSGFLQQLADADSKELVKEVQEYYGDFYAVNPDTYSINVNGALNKSSSAWNQNSHRIIDGLLASLLAIKKKPTIRFSANSDVTRYVAETIAAMIHDLLTITNNRVSLANSKGIREELQEVVLSIDQDSFYKDNLYKNYGDLGESIKELVDSYQEKSETNATIKTIDDMKKFIESYPQFQKFSTTVSKHVSLMDEMSRIISEDNLMEISEIQQELAVNRDHNNAYSRVCDIVEDINQKFSKEDKLVLVMLYSIRYEDGHVHELMEKLRAAGVSSSDIALIPTLLDYAGSARREGDLLGTKNILTFVKRVAKRGLQGVSNIYTQHSPLLQDILDNVNVNKLPEKSYPYLSTSTTKDRPSDIIIFIVGGITFEEAYSVYKFNSLNPGTKLSVRYLWFVTHRFASDLILYTGQSLLKPPPPSAAQSQVKWSIIETILPSGCREASLSDSSRQSLPKQRTSVADPQAASSIENIQMH